MTASDWCVLALLITTATAVAWAIAAHCRADNSYDKGRADEAREQQALRERPDQRRARIAGYAQQPADQPDWTVVQQWLDRAEEER